MKPDLTGITVLVVEDDRVSRRVFESVLQDLGATVRCANEGFQALELLWEAPVQVVLCDLRMPNFDGYAFIHALRKDFRMTTPVIAVTGTANEDTRNRALAEGFAGYLRKPVEGDELGAEVLRVLRR